MQEYLNTIIHSEWEKVLPLIPANSIDLVLTDPPYNTTQAEYDKELLDLPSIWSELVRVVKPGAAIVMTASQPFTTRLISSNIKWFKYCWVVEKNKVTGHLDANRKPLKAHEDVVVFYQKQAIYNPQMVKSTKHVAQPWGKQKRPNQTYSKFGEYRSKEVSNEYYPRSVLKFDWPLVPVHPNEKPVELFEYFTRTYSNPGATVLDCFAGSGTTAIAAYNTGRNFICIEKDANYHATACKRLETVKAQLRFEGWAS